MKPLRRTSALFALSAAVTLAGCTHDPNVQKRKYLESGLRYEKNGKLREAAIQFSNALKVDQNFGDACYELGKVYVQLGNPVAGYRQLMRAVDLNPSNAAARLVLGNLMVAGGAPDPATAQAKAILASRPDDADAYALLARAEQRKGDHPGTLAAIEHALSIEPNRADFHLVLAGIEASGGDRGGGSEAEHELQKAVALDPANAAAHLAYARLLGTRGELAAAAQQGSLAVQQEPRNLDARLLLGALYTRAGDTAKAEQTYRQATEELNDTENGAAVLEEYLEGSGQLPRASQAYAELTDKYAKSIPLKLVYARILMETHQEARAQALADQLTKKNGSDPEVELLDAMLLLRNKKPEDALALLQKATRNAPENVSLQLLLGEVAARKGDQAAAEAAYTQVARLQPGNLQGETGLARIADQRRDFSLLHQIADKTIASHPDAAQGYLWRGTAEANTKEAGADQDFRTALEKEPANATASLALAQLLISERRIPEGKALLEQALTRDPNLLPALDLLVSLDLMAKEPARALARIAAAVAKSPDNSALYTRLALLQAGQKDYPGAEASAQKAMQLNSGSAEAVSVYAQAALALGKPDLAVSTWQSWVAAHPDDARGLTQLGMVETARGEQTRAMEDYRKALAVQPGLAIASNNLAYLMVENGQNIDVALSLAQSARRDLPNQPSSADTLAWVYYYKGTYASARDLLEDAVKQDPNSAAIQYHLGMVYTKLNDKADAQLHLKKAAALAPNTATAKEAADALTHLS